MILLVIAPEQRDSIYLGKPGTMLIVRVGRFALLLDLMLSRGEAMAMIVRSDYRPKGAPRTWKHPALRVTLCGLAIAVIPAAHAADVAEGYKLAQRVCSRCHEIATHKAGWTDAPSFAEIANRPTTTSASLEAIIVTPHPKMLVSAARSPSEAADLAAYILSLKQK